MSLKDVQKQVDDWTNQFKLQYWSPHEMMARLMEEVGELAREVNHRWGPKKKKAVEDKKELEDEIGDIIFTLACFANLQKIDLDGTFKKTMDKLYARDASRFEKK